MNPKTVRKFPLVRRYKDSDEHRNASIAIYDDGDERWGQYRVSISHECWTGARWLPIHQDDNAFTLDAACALARRIRDEFGWTA